ncbi:hypothetical protein BGW42_001731 [Actinomortierella wolfii]|nr:hypothetical protein BGW42_001731 [Actinomortierella wolfii]
MTDNSSTQSVDSTETAVETLTTALLTSPSEPSTTVSTNAAESSVNPHTHQPRATTSPTTSPTTTTITPTTTTPSLAVNPISYQPFGPPQRVRIKLHLRVGEPRSRLRQLKDLPDPPEWVHDVMEDSYDILMARVSDRVSMFPKYHWPGEGYLCIQPTKNSPQRAYEDVSRQTYRSQLMKAHAAEIKRLVLPDEVRVNLFAYVETLAPFETSPSPSPSPSSWTGLRNVGGKGRGGAVRRGGSGGSGGDTGGVSIAAERRVADFADGERSLPYPRPPPHRPHGSQRMKKSTSPTTPSTLSQEGSLMKWTPGHRSEHETISQTQLRQIQRHSGKRGNDIRRSEDESMEDDRSRLIAAERRSPYEEEDQLEPSEYEPEYVDRRLGLGIASEKAPVEVAPQRTEPSSIVSAGDMEVDESNHSLHHTSSDDFREIEIEIQGARLKVKVSVASLRQALGLAPPHPRPAASRSIPSPAIENADRQPLRKK